MPRYLFAAMFGPVQGFIAAARRTRDLWYGSHLLSEVSRAAALHITQTSATLIFPALPDSDLQCEETPVINKVVAVIDTPDIAAFAEEVKKAARCRYKAIAVDCLTALSKYRDCDDAIDAKRWDDQVKGTIEAYVAWVAYDKGAGYKSVNDRVNALLAARKNTRDFEAAKGYAGVPKSSLDGARESVFRIDHGAKKALARLRARFGVDDSEQLDSVGLIKRVLGKEHPFPSVARVALARWIDDVAANRQDIVTQIVREYEVLVAHEVGTPIGSGLRGTRNRKDYLNLPYDCEYLLKSRMAKELRNLDQEKSVVSGNAAKEKAVREALDNLNRVIYQRDLKKEPEYTPPSEEGLYVVLLLADGDHMGALIDAAEAEAAHREISNKLAEFAKEVPDLLRKHLGVSVYAGGDDVLALLPVDSAMECARDLADLFSDKLKGPFEKVRDALCAQGKNDEASKLPPPSLSVGLAFGHVLEPLGNLRALANRAEQLAKRGPHGTSLRNALGIIIQPRGGGAIEVCGRWDEPDLIDGGIRLGFDRRLADWREAFASDLLAGSAGYRLRVLSRELRGAALAKEAQRLVSRRVKDKTVEKRIGTMLLRPGTNKDAGGGAEAVAAISSIEQLEKEWLAARWLDRHIYRSKHI